MLEQHKAQGKEMRLVLDMLAQQHPTVGMYLLAPC